MSDPTCTIVMPTYNQAQYIDRAVMSLLAQDVTDFELIIVNDGSTDGTAAYLAGLSDPRVRVLHQENRGTTATINRGMRAARGQFVTWVSSDNLHPRWFLSAFLAAFDRFPQAAFAYSSFYVIDADDAVVDFVDFNRLFLRDLMLGDNFGGVAGFMYRRHCHDEVGYYDESVDLSSDTEMWTRLLKHYDDVYVVEPTCFFRTHASANSTARAGEFAGEFQHSLARHAQELFGADVFPLDRLYRQAGADRGRRFAALLNFAAKCRRTFPGASALGVSAQLYLAAAAIAPRHQVLDVLLALAQTSRDAPAAALPRLAQAFAQNPDLAAGEIEELMEMAGWMMSQARALGATEATPLVCPDTPFPDRADLRARRTFSYFGAQAAASLGLAGFSDLGLAGFSGEGLAGL